WTGTIRGKGRLVVKLDKVPSAWYGGTMLGPGETTVQASGDRQAFGFGWAGMKPTLDGRRLFLGQGVTTSWSAGDFKLIEGASVVNSDQFLANSPGVMGNEGGDLNKYKSSFENNGDLVKDNKETITDIGTTFTSSGKIEVKAGTLRF